jgi:hypothetical protein
LHGWLLAIGSPLSFPTREARSGEGFLILRAAEGGVSKDEETFMRRLLELALVLRDAPFKRSSA